MVTRKNLGWPCDASDIIIARPNNANGLVRSSGSTLNIATPRNRPTRNVINRPLVCRRVRSSGNSRPFSCRHFFNVAQSIELRMFVGYPIPAGQLVFVLILAWTRKRFRIRGKTIAYSQSCGDSDSWQQGCARCTSLRASRAARPLSVPICRGCS